MTTPNLSGLSTITIYGNILRFDCSSNEPYLKALDVSHNTALQTLSCVGNQLNNLDISKNTTLQHLRCMFNQISSLDVSKNIILTRLECVGNQLSNLDVSKNTALKRLECGINQLSNLDISKNTALVRLGCEENQLSSLDISKNTALKRLACNNNLINSIDLSQNRALLSLDCSENRLTSLDVSKNTNLTGLFCCDNQLDSLNVSKNTALTGLFCCNNLFSVQALDLLYCSLPNRTDSISPAVISVVTGPGDANWNTVMATNIQNARDKNWNAKYAYSNGSNDMPPTNGTYDCSVGIEEPTAYKHMTIYPNPVADVLHIDTPGNIIEVQIYNISGALISTTKNSKHISVAHLPKGVYTLKAITAQGAYNQKIVKE